MASLEDKISRLPPDLQKEVEEFVDFLIQRRGGHYSPGSHELMFHDSSPSQPVKPVVLADEIRLHHDVDPAPRHFDPGPVEDDRLSDRADTQPHGKGTSSKEPSKLLDWID